MKTVRTSIDLYEIAVNLLILGCFGKLAVIIHIYKKESFIIFTVL